MYQNYKPKIGILEFDSIISFCNLFKRRYIFVRTPILSHIDQHVTHHITLRPHARYSHGCHLTWPGTVCVFWLAYMIVSLASIGQRTRADMASREPKAAPTYEDRHT